MQPFVKRRDPPVPGSIPAALDMFSAEVRFYREIAAHIELRVPDCYESHDGDDGTVLVLENLSEWTPGADPIEVAGRLGEHHRRWQDLAAPRWPWLRPVGAAADLIGVHFDRTWTSTLSRRSDLTPRLRRLGERLLGRVPEAEWAEAGSGPPTLIHGDASKDNMRTGPGGEVVFLDWEDVRAAAGVVDLAWLVISSVEPGLWDEVIRAYGEAGDLPRVLPSAAAQGLFALSGLEEGGEPAAGWIRRLDAACARLG